MEIDLKYQGYPRENKISKSSRCKKEKIGAWSNVKKENQPLKSV